MINHAALIAGHAPLHVPRRHICWKLLLMAMRLAVLLLIMAMRLGVHIMVLATLGVGMWVLVLGCLSILQ